jgi:hypothetical protein
MRHSHEDAKHLHRPLLVAFLLPTPRCSSQCRMTFSWHATARPIVQDTVCDGTGGLMYSCLRRLHFNNSVEWSPFTRLFLYLSAGPLVSAYSPHVIPPAPREYCRGRHDPHLPRPSISCLRSGICRYIYSLSKYHHFAPLEE